MLNKLIIIKLDGCGIEEEKLRKLKVGMVVNMNGIIGEVENVVIDNSRDKGFVYLKNVKGGI